jgi:hypothetical protein
MKFCAIFAALTVGVGAASFSTLALAQGGPPTPRPAAGALPHPNPNAESRSFRTQTTEEQKRSTTAAPVDAGRAGMARVARADGPPTPRPAAGALPSSNPSAVSGTFRTQTAEEQQHSAQSSAMDAGQAGHAR